MKLGLSPNNVRIENLKLIMSLVRERDYTYKEIAQRLGLSVPAINKIVAELVEKNLVSFCQPITKNTAGRRPNRIEIRSDTGFVILILLSNDEGNQNFNIIACDLKRNILSKHSITPTIRDTSKLTKDITNTIRKILKEETLLNKQLYNICIAAPGIIDEKNGLLIATSLEIDDKSYDIRNQLQNEFSVPVYIKGLLSCQLLSELKYGALKNGSRLALFLHISDGCGMSFAINNDVFSGAHGFAGEIGFVMSNLVAGYHMSLIDSSKCSIEQEISLVKLKYDTAKKIGLSANEINFDNIAKEYLKKNPPFVDTVNEHAKRVGSVIKNLIILLDPDNIIIGGKILKLGESYLEILRNCIYEEYYKRVNIIIPNMDNGLFNGLFETAIKEAIDKIILSEN